MRTDDNGTYVLMIEEKSTPLGTRYVAARVDVTVEAEDDTHSAVAGGLMMSDSIITTTSKIVEPGDYVRLKAKG